MPLTPYQYSQALGEILTLDNKVKSMTPKKMQKQISRAERACERRPFKKPGMHFPIIEPIVVFVALFLVLAALMIVFGITGMISKYLVLSYILFIPFQLMNFIFTLFGNPNFLHGQVTIANIRLWAAENNNLWFFGQALLSFVFVAALAAILVFIIVLIKSIIDHQRDLARFPKTPAEYEEYENERQERARSELDRLRRQNVKVANYEQRINNLCNTIGLAPQYRYVNYVKVFKSYIDSGRAYTLADAINLYHAEVNQQEQLRLAREAKEHAEAAEQYAQKMYDEHHRKY